MRGRVAVGIAAAIVVALFAANYLGWISPEPGPLHAPGNATGLIAAGGSTVTAAYILSETDVDGPLELRASEAVGVDESLEVGEPQVLVCSDELACDIAYAFRQWPPRGWSPEPLEDYVVDGDRDTVTVVGVPLTLPQGQGRYRLRGIRIDYQQGLRRYRAEVGPNLAFTARD